jgi:hypothetical protein
LSIVIKKGLIGEQDENNWDGVTSTFTRETSTGATITLLKEGYDVDCLVVYGGGVNYNSSTINAALTAIGTINKVTLVLRPGAWVMNANITIPANINLKMPAGAVITTTGFTLTFNQQPEAGPYQIFTGTGNVVSLKSLQVTWFGSPTGTDDTLIIQAAINTGAKSLDFGNLTTWISSNLTAASNQIWDNGTITFKTGSTGNLVDASSTTNFVLGKNLTLEGGTTATYLWASTVGNRTGYYATGAIENRIEGKIKHFNKNGIEVTTMGYNPIHGKSLKILGAGLENNYINLNLDTRAEYVQMIGSDLVTGKYGVFGIAGNYSGSGNNINDNAVNYYLGAGSNDGHGSEVGSKINHASSFNIYTNGITYGFSFVGCHAYAGDLLFTDSRNVQFTNGHISTGAIYTGGGGWNLLADNVIYSNVVLHRANGGSQDGWELRGNKDQTGKRIFQLGTTSNQYILAAGLTPASNVSSDAIVKFGAGSLGRWLYGNVADTSSYDTSTGIVTIGTDGIYQFNITVVVTNHVAAANKVSMYLREGSSTIKTFVSRMLAASETASPISLTYTGYFSVGETVGLYIASDSGVDTVSAYSNLEVFTTVNQ